MSSEEGSAEAWLLAAVDDPEAFGGFYDAHGADLLRFFVRRTADVQVAADLAAETFAQAFVSRHRFRSRGAGSAKAWLYGIARHQLGRYARRERVSERYRRKLALERLFVSDDDVRRVEELAEIKDMRVALRIALAQLPASQLDAVRLRVVDELPYVEVARQLGCSEGAARVRVTRGLARLAEVLDR